MLNREFIGIGNTTKPKSAVKYLFQRFFCIFRDNHEGLLCDYWMDQHNFRQYLTHSPSIWWPMLEMSKQKFSAVSWILYIEWWQFKLHFREIYRTEEITTYQIQWTQWITRTQPAKHSNFSKSFLMSSLLLLFFLFFLSNNFSFVFRWDHSMYFYFLKEKNITNTKRQTIDYGSVVWIWCEHKHCRNWTKYATDTINARTPDWNQLWMRMIQHTIHSVMNR